MTGRVVFWLIGIALMLVGCVHAMRFMLDAAFAQWNGLALAWTINFIVVGGICAILAEKGW